LLASNADISCWRESAQIWFGESEIAEYTDGARGLYRAAAFVDGRLDACVFVGPAAAPPQWDVLKPLFEADVLEEGQRRGVLSGRSIDGVADPGPIVCACFGIGLNTIRAAIADGLAMSVENIGTKLRAGTNCGSCLPELKRIVADERCAPIA
jgi:assimilatory nitrate reductase catalytic subunit